MNGTVLVAHSPQFSRQTPVTPRCGCEDYEVSLCVAHSCFTRDVGGAWEGRGGTLRQVTSVSARTETETGGRAECQRDQSRQGSRRDNIAANANNQVTLVV